MARIQWQPKCDDPTCQGWVHNDGGDTDIQRCDMCKRYSSDESASRAHRKFRSLCAWCNQLTCGICGALSGNADRCVSCARKELFG